MVTKKKTNRKKSKNKSAAKTTIRIKPSDLTIVIEDQLGLALANVRREIRNARGDDIKELQKKREQLNKALDEFVYLHLQSIDSDPLIKAAVDELALLTQQIFVSVREMQTVKKAIKKATNIIGYADKFLGIVLNRV